MCNPNKAWHGRAVHVQFGSSNVAADSSRRRTVYHVQTRFRLGLKVASAEIWRRQVNQELPRGRSKASDRLDEKD